MKEEEDKEESERRIKQKAALETIKNANASTSNKSVSKPNSKDSKTKRYEKKTTKKDIEILMCKLMELMAWKNGDCKGSEKVKKAMIWPKKMLPLLEKMLSNRVAGSETESATPLSNGFNDNWDSTGGNNELSKSHHKHHGKIHRLMKLLRAKLNGRESGGNWDDDLSNDDGMSKGANTLLLKQLLNQLLGRTDRNGVLQEMMQEFFLANGVDRNGEEAREALNELMGRKNFYQLNNVLQSSSIEPGPNQGMMAPLAQPETLGTFQGGGTTPAGSDGLIHAQMLPNGAIAPMANPAAFQQSPLINQAVSAPLQGRAQGQGLLANQVLPAMLPRPVTANQRMYMGMEAPTANQNAFQERQLANEESLQTKLADEREIGEGAVDMNDIPERDSYTFSPRPMTKGYSDLFAERALRLRPSFQSPFRGSIISSVSRPEIEDDLNQQPTVRATASRIEGSQFYANHNGLNAALEHDSILRRIGAFRRGKVLKVQGSPSKKPHVQGTTKSHIIKGVLKLKTL